MAENHGVQYTLQNIDAKKRKVTVEDLVAAGVSHVHLFCVDYSNTRRVRILTLPYFQELINSPNGRGGVNIVQLVLGFVNLTVAENFPMTREYIHVIDLETLRVLHGVGPTGGAVGAVLGRFEYKDALPAPVRNNPRSKWEVDLCPRTLLERIVREHQSIHSTEFLVGFESEFILLSATRPAPTAPNVHQFAASTGLLAGSKEAIVLAEISTALQASGIPIQMYHAEAAPGQYEIVSGPLRPLEAADALVLTREVIVHVAARHGLHATFAPRPFPKNIGSAAHAHISVHRHGETKLPFQLSSGEEQFLAGVLEHLQAIAAFTLPSPPSYKRVGDGVWSGGTYVAYGTENRETPIRLTNSSSPGSRNFEMRFIDGTANPYLALAAILAGGLSGLAKQTKLPTEDLGDKLVASLTDEERKAFRVTKRLALDLKQVRQYLEEDVELGEILGKEFVGAFLSVSRTLEVALTEGADEQEQLCKSAEFC